MRKMVRTHPALNFVKIHTDGGEWASWENPEFMIKSETEGYSFITPIQKIVCTKLQHSTPRTTPNKVSKASPMFTHNCLGVIKP
jgi:hypothetical protein